MAWHLAQLNVARLRAPLDDPLIADFVDNLERVNTLGEHSTGYVGGSRPTRATPPRSAPSTIRS